MVYSGLNYGNVIAGNGIALAESNDSVDVVPG